MKITSKNLEYQMSTCSGFRAMFLVFLKKIVIDMSITLFFFQKTTTMTDGMLI